MYVFDLCFVSRSWWLCARPGLALGVLYPWHMENSLEKSRFDRWLQIWLWAFIYTCIPSWPEGVLEKLASYSSMRSLIKRHTCNGWFEFSLMFNGILFCLALLPKHTHGPHSEKCVFGYVCLAKSLMSPRFLCMVGHGSKDPSYGHRSAWSDCTDAFADLGLFLDARRHIFLWLRSYTTFHYETP